MRIGEAVFRLRGEQAGDDLIQRGRHFRPIGADARRRLRHPPGNFHRRRAGRRERRLAGEAPVQHSAQAVEVGPDVGQVGVLGLLRGHVFERAEQHARLGEPLADVLGQAEVEQLGVVALGDQDVGRLDVAVDEATGVGGRQGRRDLVGELARPADGQRAAGADQRFQVRPVHELHDQVMQDRLAGPRAVGLAGIERGDDVRVPQRADGPHLGAEPQQQPRVLVRRERQHLDRRRPAEQHVLGPVDDAHAAGPEPVEDAVVAEHEAEVTARL